MERGKGECEDIFPVVGQKNYDIQKKVGSQLLRKLHFASIIVYNGDEWFRVMNCLMKLASKGVNQDDVEVNNERERERERETCCETAKERERERDTKEYTRVRNCQFD